MSPTHPLVRPLLACTLALCFGCRPYAVVVPRARAVDEAFFLRESTVGVEERGDCVLIPVPLNIGLSDVPRSPFAVRYVVVPLSVDGETERAREKIAYKLFSTRPAEVATACQELSDERHGLTQRAAPARAPVPTREPTSGEDGAGAAEAPRELRAAAAEAEGALPYQVPAAAIESRAGFFEQDADQKQLQRLEPAVLESATETARAGELSLEASGRELNHGAVEKTLFLLVRYESGLPDAGDLVRLDVAHVSNDAEQAGELSGRTIIDLRRVRKPHPAAAIALGLGTIIFATAGVLAATDRGD